jgi:hypothetical protein
MSGCFQNRSEFIVTLLYGEKMKDESLYTLKDMVRTFTTMG